MKVPKVEEMPQYKHILCLKLSLNVGCDLETFNVFHKSSTEEHEGE